MTDPSPERRDRTQSPGRLPPLDPHGDHEELDHIIGSDESRQSVETSRDWGYREAFDALANIACTIGSNLDLRSLVRDILDVGMEAVGATRGALFLTSGEHLDPVPAAITAIPGNELAHIEDLSRSILATARKTGLVYSDNAKTDPRFEESPSVRSQKVRSVLCIPIAHRGAELGIVYVDHADGHAFPDHTRTFFQAFAGIAAVALENARLHEDNRRELIRMGNQLASVESFGRIVTVSPRMRTVLENAANIARFDTSVMLLGESGTGKEVLARSIHQASPRALGPFIAYNCAAVPTSLMESLFFGHTKGAFTGAVHSNPGLFRQADRGVLFLDEIAELDLSLQAKLLRVLEEGTVWPLGADRDTAVDVRVISATSRNLANEVQSGRFREDLFFRLNVLEIRIPPLRDRVEDVPALVEFFIKKHGGESASMCLTERATEYLQSLPWRGNVRELENLVQRVLVLVPQSTVDAEDMIPLVTDIFSGGSGGGPPPPEPGAPRTISDREREAIVAALQRTNGNKSQAAQLLGIHRNSLARRMAKLGIQ